MNDDLIRKQDVIDALWKIKDERDSVYYTSAIYTAVETIKQLPSAPSEQKHGEWIDKKNYWYRCSNCGQHYQVIQGYMYYNYCPNCGAKMDGKVKNE